MNHNNTDTTHIENNNQNQQYECPVCSELLYGIVQLNSHLDIQHGFADDSQLTSSTANSSTISLPSHSTTNTQTNKKQAKSHNSNHNSKRITPTQSATKQIGFSPNSIHKETEKSISNDSETSSINTHKNFHLKISHYQPRHSTNNCTTCGKIIDFKHSINCRKCGKIQCFKHCRNAIKLNKNAEYDHSISGVWCRCCHKCFIEKPGYNDFGLVVDKFESFQKQRTLKNNDKELRILQLDLRLVKLVNGINKILEKHKYTLFSNIQINSDIRSLEQQQIVPWDMEATSCGICYCDLSTASLLFVKKHHCRLCGTLICDKMTCSKEFPLLLICAIIESANEYGKSKLPMDTRLAKNNATRYPDLQIRLCSNCIQLTFTKKKFQMDLQQAPSPLLEYCEKLYNLRKVLDSMIPTFSGLCDNIIESSLKGCNNPNDLENSEQFIKMKGKIFELFFRYEEVSNYIDKLTCSTDSEKLMRSNIKTYSAIYIAENFVPLRSKLGAILQKVLAKEQNSISNNDEMRNIEDIKKIKKFREELVVLQEQKFLVEKMMDTAKRNRKFDELEVLKKNLDEINGYIEETQAQLGNEAFVSL
ncbi:uncharacterized protein SCODWIG_00463 [Saccharomycodes ludwigii]|uniref:FYVE-type domain-containing protein n=1 Tax=Saccharomycodes ludwigii TaxID=36035 RepID=A0A376B242_9ASCO|nr:hypothetical protein SCDLUD_004719 [Saccharomycodes ludwigii]KAH3899283.1 hypothetical protein SCDLUD_004719 [Saccharomycodes ludwigii]SSD58702.1 uncharacterized protein SCODWIG_00463 [Saccharomycodes ludwigii]